MSNLPDKVYQFGPLSSYSLKQRVTIRLADIIFYVLIKALGSGTRFEVRGTEHLEAVKAIGKLPIISFWHDRIFLGTYFFRNQGIVVMTSQSFDGEYIARFIQRFGYGAIRGSATRGGARALIEMIKSMRNGHAMSLTLDGPRGPRYNAKPGAVLLAKKTGHPLIPFVVQPKKFFTLNSWDKMQIPIPFSRALAAIGEPIYVDQDADEETVAAKLEEVQRSLDDLVKQCDEWSKKDS